MKIETRAVLGAAYLSSPSAKLTHAAEIDEAGAITRVLCGRVNPEHLADPCAADTGAMPTCPRCLASLSARALRSIPSTARVEASRENGKKGGRPRKARTVAITVRAGVTVRGTTYLEDTKLDASDEFARYLVERGDATYR